jgi:deoxycytidine triphosphate deaminase
LAKIKKERQNSFADLKPGNSYPISLGNRFDQTNSIEFKGFEVIKKVRLRKRTILRQKKAIYKTNSFYPDKAVDYVKIPKYYVIPKAVDNL